MDKVLIDNIQTLIDRYQKEVDYIVGTQYLSSYKKGIAFGQHIILKDLRQLLKEVSSQAQTTKQ